MGAMKNMNPCHSKSATRRLERVPQPLLRLFAGTSRHKSNVYRPHNFYFSKETPMQNIENMRWTRAY
jgi:hypothetical protein